MGKLNTLRIQKETKPGIYGDGDGLYLQITDKGSKSWIFRFMLNKRTRMMGLGSFGLVSLAEARLKAFECRKLVREGIDPIERRELQRQNQRLAEERAITFDECAAQYIESHKSAWKNEKHQQQWTNTLKTYASPLIGNLPVQSIETEHIIKVLSPLWGDKTETASRVRSRLELILAWATVRGFRTGENPAIWRNHLDKLLPKRSKVQKVQHFHALPFKEIGDFVSKLRNETGVAARALEFLILTACRTSEVLNAKWSEINFDERLWIIPPERMKAGVEHRVPLTPRTFELLTEMRRFETSEYIFPGSRPQRPISSHSMLMLLRRMKVETTVHGFRSTFRDWAAEMTNFPNEVCEQALAHTLKDKVESAYRRGDLLLKRRALMERWAEYCSTSCSKIATVTDLQKVFQDALRN